MNPREAERERRRERFDRWLERAGGLWTAGALGFLYLAVPLYAVFVKGAPWWVLLVLTALPLGWLGLIAWLGRGTPRYRH